MQPTVGALEDVVQLTSNLQNCFINYPRRLNSLHLRSIYLYLLLVLFLVASQGW